MEENTRMVSAKLWGGASLSAVRVSLFFLVLLFSACASQKTRYREGNLKGDETSLSVEDEKKMTQDSLTQVRQEYPAVNSPELQSYVSALGNKIVRANGLVGHPYNYTFTVVESKNVNAFALPAGTIFVTAPLMAMAESEAELAGVLGHEIGHVKARHAAIRLETAKKERGQSWLFGVGGGVLGGATGFGAGKLICEKGDTSCLVKASAIGAAAGVGGGLLIQKFAFMANSQEDELEGDRIGFRTAVKAGYDKDQVGGFYTKLAKLEEQSQKNHVPVLSSINDAISTHPPGKERVAQLDEMAHQATKSGTLVSTPAFERARAIARNWVGGRR